MRNLKFKELYKIATLLAIVVIFSSSCKKDNKVNPIYTDYVGTWMSMDTISIPNYENTSIKDVMTLTETSFADLRQIQFMNAWMDFVSMKGTLSVNGNLINVNITEVGTSFNMVTFLPFFPLGTIKSYKEGTPEFDSILSQVNQSKTFKSEFSVSDNKLTIKTDLNKDGDYLDDKEITIYSKQ